MAPHERDKGTVCAMKKKTDVMSEEAMKEQELPGIEESFRILDGLLEKIEDEETPLEESFRLYEEGLKLVKHARSRIDRVEQNLRILSEEAGEDGDEEI